MIVSEFCPHTSWYKVTIDYYNFQQFNLTDYQSVLAVGVAVIDHIYTFIVKS